MNAKRYKNILNTNLVLAIASLLYFVFVLGTIVNTFFSALAAILLFLILLMCNTKSACIILAVLTPNSMIVSLPSMGIRILGFAYVLVFIKLAVTKNAFPPAVVVFALLVIALICCTRLLSGGFRDLGTCIQTLLVITFWYFLLKNENKTLDYTLYKSFVFGAFLMSIGMVMNKFLNGENRMTALLDDANYTGVVFSVLFSSSLLFLFFKIRKQFNILVALFSLLMGLFTGSRAFLLSIGFVVLIYLILGLKYKRFRIILPITLMLVLVFLIMLFLNVPFVVNIYDSTIGRTLSLSSEYHEGKFMDITSGRLFLWEYYLNELASSPKNILVGLGFSTYYLEINGGYGLVAHNSFVSGLMGFGVIGLVAIIMAYIKLLSLNQPYKKNKEIFLSSISILAALLVGYFFLDGLLDVRLSMYIGIFLIAQRTCINSFKFQNSVRVCKYITTLNRVCS